MLIKCRVWNGEQYISPDYIDRNGIAHWKENSIPESSSETELFTGMHDSQGVEIYEGDIVRVYLCGNMFDQKELPCDFIVKMKYAKWYVEPIKNKNIGIRTYSFDGYDYKNEDCEVIGNIHDSEA